MATEQEMEPLDADDMDYLPDGRCVPKDFKFPTENKSSHAASGKVAKVMHEWKAGTLHSGSKKGPKVTDQKQALAIGFSEQRKAARGGYA